MHKQKVCNQLKYDVTTYIKGEKIYATTQRQSL